MPHRGRTYPFFNPARVFEPIEIWPLYAPTEWKWSVTSWAGAYGGFFPTSGRGMFPTWSPSSPNQLSFDLFVHGSDGSTCHLQLVINLVGDGTTNVTPHVFLNGVDQVESPPPTARPFSLTFRTINIFAGVGSVMKPGYLLDPVGFFATPVLYTDHPAPPASTPF